MALRTSASHTRHPQARTVGQRHTTTVHTRHLISCTLFCWELLFLLIVGVGVGVAAAVVAWPPIRLSPRRRSQRPRASHRHLSSCLCRIQHPRRTTGTETRTTDVAHTRADWDRTVRSEHDRTVRAPHGFCCRHTHTPTRTRPTHRPMLICHCCARVLVAAHAQSTAARRGRMAR